MDPTSPAFAGTAEPPPSGARFAQPNASKSAVRNAAPLRSRVEALEDRIVLLQFVVGDAGPVVIPLDPLVLDEFREHVIPQRLPHELRLLGQLHGLDEAARKASDNELIALLGTHLVDVLFHGGTKGQVAVHSLEPRGQAAR